MFYHKKQKVVVEIIDFTQDEFKLSLINRQSEMLWVYRWSKTKPHYKLHEITDDGVLFSCFAWTDPTPKFENWNDFYFRMRCVSLTELHDTPKDICPECGADIIAKMSGIECSSCDYWFCL